MFQLMTCCLFSALLSPEQMATSYQLHAPLGTNLSDILIDIQIFLLGKVHFNVCVQNVDNVVLASICVKTQT